MLTYFYGDTITYDAIGNPTNVYEGYEGYELSWQGRQLKTYRKYWDEHDGLVYGDTITYTYNADGIRTSKTISFLSCIFYTVKGLNQLIQSLVL